MIHKKLMPFFLFVLICCATFISSSGNVVHAANQSQTYYFPESLSQSQSMTTTIPDLSSITSATVDTGSVSFYKNGNDVTLNVSNGTWTSREAYTDPTYYSKFATDYRTSSSNSFPSSVSYSDGTGYSGTLQTSGGSYVSSGSFTPSDSKIASGSSGSYTWGQHCVATDVVEYKNKPSMASSEFYNSGGYSGTLYLSTSPGTHPDSPALCGSKTMVRYLEYYSYSGTVTKPSSDTRIYRQDYAGTVYKSGTAYKNYKYSYVVNLNYTTNEAPKVNGVTVDQYIVGQNGTVTFSGTTTDYENDNVTVTASFVGVTKTTTVPNGNGVWNITFTGSELQEGTYNSIVVNAFDGRASVSKTLYFSDIKVDLTNPFYLAVTQTPKNQTKGNVEIQINVGDAFTGVKNIKTPDNSLFTKSTMVYNVSNNGDYLFVVEDKAGNQLPYTVTVNNIDSDIATLERLTLTEKSNGSYKVTVRTSDISGIKGVGLNTGELLLINQDKSLFSIDNLVTKPTHIEIEDNAGNLSGPITFLPFPSLVYEAPYSPGSTMKEDVHVTFTGTDKISYVIGIREFECAQTPCEVKIAKNDTVTFANSSDIKASLISKEITNIDKTLTVLNLYGQRNTSNEKEVVLNWDLSIVNPVLDCVNSLGNRSFNPPASPYSFIGENITYTCTLTGMYQGYPITSNTTSIYPEYGKGAPSQNPVDILARNTISHTVFIEKNIKGETYFLNINKSNTDDKTVPVPTSLSN